MKPSLLRIGALAILLTLSSCVPLEILAPPLDATIQPYEGNPVQVAQGREIYINACSGCHTVQHVLAFSPAEWEEILPTMNKKAELTPKEAADLHAYLMAVHSTVPKVEP